MKFSRKDLEKLFNTLATLLQGLFSRSKISKDRDNTPPNKPQVITIKTKVTKVEPAKQEPVPEPINKGFLICPIYGNDKSGSLLTSHTIKISSVLDHSGTAIDPDSKNRWGIRAKDQKVKTFNGEIGDGELTAGPPYGYTKKVPAPFFPNKEINYVGVYDSRDTYGQTYYLNYDGHAGYDFPYQLDTPLVAPATGKLFKASDGKDVIYGASWSKDHSFYIEHENGFLTWFRHCNKLEDKIEQEIGNDYEKSVFVTKGEKVAFLGNFESWKNKGTSTHLHFEVRNKENEIVDPYADQLWED